jgi:phosphoglycerate dehydrogenase-like enzyme
MHSSRGLSVNAADVVVMVHTPPLSAAELNCIRSVSQCIQLLPPEPDARRGERTHAAWITDRLAARPDTEVLFTSNLPDSWRPGWALRWAQLASAGVDQEQQSPLWRTSDVAVTTANGIHGAAMSQWALAMILHHAHHLGEVLRYKETRQWPDRLALAGTVLIGKTLGVIGYGSAGMECARLARAVGMRVLAIRRSASSSAAPERFAWAALAARAASDGREEVLPTDALDRVLAESDYLVITAPLTPETRGLIGERELGLLKPTAFLVNVSRGAVVDETALIRALRDGRLAGAALDVFEREPLEPDSPFFELPNVVVSPHMSGVFRDSWGPAVQVFRANLARYLNGQPLLNAVDRTRGY